MDGEVVGSDRFSLVVRVFHEGGVRENYHNLRQNAVKAATLPGVYQQPKNHHRDFAQNDT